MCGDNEINESTKWRSSCSHGPQRRVVSTDCWRQTRAVSSDWHLVQYMNQLLECLKDKYQRNQYREALLCEASDVAHESTQVKCNHQQQQQAQPHSNPESKCQVLHPLFPVHIYCTYTIHMTHHAGWSSLPGDCCSSVECSSIVCSFCAIAAAVPPQPQDSTDCNF